MAGFNILDIVLIAVVVLSGLLALLRGFVHEVLSFGAWVGAALVSLYAFPYLQPHMRSLIAVHVVADIVSGVALFLLALVVFSLIARSIARRVQESSLSALDRTLGLVFGLVRGAVLVSLAWLIFAWLVPEQQRPNWVQEARAVPMLKQGADMLRSLVPESFLESVGDAARLYFLIGRRLGLGLSARTAGAARVRREPRVGHHGRHGALILRQVRRGGGRNGASRPCDWQVARLRVCPVF